MALTLTQNRVEVGMTVADIDMSLAFYRDTLGFTEAAQIPLEWGGVLHVLQLGEAVVKLAANDDVPVSGNPPGGATGGTGLRWITFWITDVAAAVAACAAAGRPIPVELNTSYPGIAFAFVEDPDGTWIELVQAVEA